MFTRPTDKKAWYLHVHAHSFLPFVKKALKFLQHFYVFLVTDQVKFIIIIIIIITFIY